MASAAEGSGRLRRAVGTGTWVIDLDGVIWLAGEPIDGVGAAVERLRERGVRVLFVTNNAEPTVAQLVQRLARAGIEAGAEDLVTSAHAAASLVDAAQTVLAVGGPGVDEALQARGTSVVHAGAAGAADADAVVVGLTHDFDYEVLAAAATAVRRGARLIGTNEDPTHPTPAGLLPGSGALVAAVATAAETEPELAGKPHRPMVDLVRSRAQDVTVVVGDRPATDGRLARALGVPYALVRSGVVAPGAAVPGEVDLDQPDLGALVSAVLCG